MTFFDKLKADAAPHIAKFKAASALTQIGVAVGALVAVYAIAAMLPMLIIVAITIGCFYLIHTMMTK